VKSGIVHEAVMDAYQTRLPIGRFPVYVLSLAAAPQFCDVNVHPTKLEVRFADENAVYEAVNSAVRVALDGQNMIPSVELPVVKLAAQPEVKAVTPPVAEVDRGIKGIIKKPLGSKKLTFSDPAAAVKSLPPTASPLPPSKREAGRPRDTVKAEILQMPKKPEQIQIPQKVDNTFFKDYRIVGQVFGTYWVIEQGASVFYLDQHAAHERVMFEELSRKMASGLQDGLIQSQSLLTPIAVNVQTHEREAVMANLSLLENLGFEIEELGENAIAVRGVPYIFGASAGAAFFNDVVDVLVSDVVGGKINDMVAVAMKINSVACKAAVKANDRLSYIEAKALVEQALKLENPFTCPHGRPTIVEISEKEVEKMFKRIQ